MNTVLNVLCWLRDWVPAGLQGSPDSRLSLEEKHRRLWRKIEQFQLDDPEAEYPMSARLADEQGWTPEFTGRVLEEYKRFIFLCATAGKMVSPSYTVDEAWHLHLLYTRSYLEGLCLNIIGRMIHHSPARGGKKEETRFGNMYAETLDLYRRAFGEPPRDIWGPDNGKNVRKMHKDTGVAGKKLDPQRVQPGDPRGLVQEVVG